MKSCHSVNNILNMAYNIKHLDNDFNVNEPLLPFNKAK